MGSWQSKILYTLIIFGAGFVTAVYFLVPSPAAAAELAQNGEMSTGSCQTQNTAGCPDIISQEWAL